MTPVALPTAAPVLVNDNACVVNDVHSQLNATRMHAVVQPATVGELREALRQARASGSSIAIAGGRHAMGGQQFAQSGVLLDTRGLDRVLAFDRERGLITVEGGIQWPALLGYLESRQRDHRTHWGIIQKQTGADRLSIAGALSCNAHGRGLALKPMVDQVEAFDLMDHLGRTQTCSRSQNAELFRLAIGGYGLFGFITRVELRLRPRVKVRRVVTLEDTATVAERFEDRIREGFLYGDYQFTIDAADASFLRRGVFSCYQPVAADTPLTENPIGFSQDDWARLIDDAHHHKGRAFQMYASRYQETSGQIYWSDAQLAAAYVENYHEGLDRAAGATVKASEMITEIFVPRSRLAAFMEDARIELAARHANVIYGTVRVIDRDDESFLAWAREPFACVVFNLHLEHTPRAIAEGAEAFQSLIDIGIRHGGSYYLTYHRWARPDQVETCYPQMPEFLARKRQHDPNELFQSDWYRHYRDMFGAP